MALFDKAKKFSDVIFLITYKNVKNLSMRPNKYVEAINVTIPLGTPDEEIDKFCCKNLEWAKKVLEKSPEEFRLPDIEEEEKFRDLFGRLFYRRAAEMGVKNRIRKINMSYMTTRWGSCQPERGVVSFNRYLWNKPVECIDYVIVHEFSHFFHRGHTPEFWAHVERYCPNWRHLRSLLRNS